MKRSLLVNGPFLCGVQVFASWFKQERVKNGLIPLPCKSERPIGGHAICVMGYDDRQELFKFKNSWGRKWAENGYGYLSYQYMDRYCSDAWSATDLIEDPKALVKVREAVLRQFA